MSGSSFDATIEYGKLAITLVASLGAGIGLALCTLLVGLSEAALKKFTGHEGEIQWALWCLIAAAALPPASAALAYLAQCFFSEVKNTGTPQDDFKKKKANVTRRLACGVWAISLLAFVIGCGLGVNLLLAAAKAAQP